MILHSEKECNTIFDMDFFFKNKVYLQWRSRFSLISSSLRIFSSTKINVILDLIPLVSVYILKNPLLSYKCYHVVFWFTKL